MEWLPDELVLLILQRLPARALLRATRVCRRWAALAARLALQLHRREDAALVHSGLRVLFVTAPHVALLRPLQVAYNLRHLTVHAAAPLDAHALAALQHLQHLRHLDVFARARVLEIAVLPALRRLSSLVVNDTPGPGILRALAGGPLRALHMYGRTFYFAPRELRTMLDAQRAHLCEITLRCAELRDRDYEAIGACENLVSLQLYSCWMLTAAGAAHLSRPRRLRRLHVTGARMLRPRALAALVRALPPRVVELTLSSSWFSDEHAPLLAARLPALRVLELWRCPLSADGALRLVAALAELRDFDSDVALQSAHLSALRSHANLVRLRALLPPQWLHPRAGLRVRQADARVPRRFARGGGEGFRAELFYFWSRDLELPPPRAPPPFDDDDDDACDDVALLVPNSE